MGFLEEWQQLPGPVPAPLGGSVVSPHSLGLVYKLTLSQSQLQRRGQGLAHTLEHSSTALVENFTSSELSAYPFPMTPLYNLRMTSVFDPSH